jgi:uncharacterized protein
MPIIKQTDYQPPFLFQNTHVNTIYSNLMRPVMPLPYQRERVEFSDGDFLDLDWSKTGSDKLLFCVHGLEGHARKHYMAAMMKFFNAPPAWTNSDEKWDAVGMNLRSCSGEDNRLLGNYHSGYTTDLAYILDTIIASKKYKQIALVGFSIGGNIVLKYAGEMDKKLSSTISHIVALSVPCDLTACSMAFETPKNCVYLAQFLMTLKQKIRRKAAKFSDSFDLKGALKAKNFRDFDNAFTAPVNGFDDCFDYWDKASCLPYLHNISAPTLLVNTLDDTFLAPSCFPYNIAAEKPDFYLETPEKGGHLGYMWPDKDGYLWTERRTWQFIHAPEKSSHVKSQLSSNLQKQ